MKFFFLQIVFGCQKKLLFHKKRISLNLEEHPNKHSKAMLLHFDSSLPTTLDLKREYEILESSKKEGKMSIAQEKSVIYKLVKNNFERLVRLSSDNILNKDENISDFIELVKAVEQFKQMKESGGSDTGYNNLSRRVSMLCFPTE